MLPLINNSLIIFDDRKATVDFLAGGAKRAGFEVLGRAYTIEEAVALATDTSIIPMVGLAIIDGDLVGYDNFNRHGIEISEILKVMNPQLRRVAHSTSGLQFGETELVLPKPIELKPYMEFLKSLLR